MKPTRRTRTSTEPLHRTRTEEPLRRRRRRWTSEQKDALLAQFAASGLTAAAFCRRAGLSGGMLSAWSRRQRALSVPAAAPSFAQVRLADAVPTMNSAAPVVVQFGTDISMSVAPDTDAVWLGQLLRAARAS